LEAGSDQTQGRVGADVQGEKLAADQKESVPGPAGGQTVEAAYQGAQGVMHLNVARFRAACVDTDQDVLYPDIVIQVIEKIMAEDDKAQNKQAIERDHDMVFIFFKC